MQSFTKTEISWIIVEFEKLAKNYEMQVDDAPTHAEANMLRLRAAAMNACKANNIPIPVIRTIEPPEKVYKKCIGGIIVVASIPKDAQVRGSVGHKCRASKAVIVDIIGDLCGEQVGISKYDLKTLYYAGDEVEIDNFDFSNEECSTGFHFFCTIEEARRY